MEKNKTNYPRLAIDMHNYIIQVSIRLFHKNLRVKIKSKIISNNVSFLEKYNYKTCLIKQISYKSKLWEHFLMPSIPEDNFEIR